MNKHLVNWLSSLGATNVTEDGEWMSWTDKSGKACYASIKDLAHEFRNAK
jgi:hypothetical protein